MSVRKIDRRKLKEVKAYSNWTGSTEKFTVRAKPRKSERIGIRLAVDQQQVRLDVAFPVTCPIAAQVMVAVWRQAGGYSPAPQERT